VKRDEVDLRGELARKPGGTYRMHFAYYGGRAVAVKVFEGPHASKVFNILCAILFRPFIKNHSRIVQQPWLYLRNYCGSIRVLSSFSLILTRPQPF
jgi:hypothetical protein